MRTQALNYYLHDGPVAFRFELTGPMTGEGARSIEQVWWTAGSLIGDRRPIIDMTFVTSVDDQGRALLTRWHNEGAQFVANTKASRTLAESILGASIPEPAAETRRWWPFPPGFFRPAAGIPWLLASLLFAFAANAANLKPETVAAWDDDLEMVKAGLHERVRPGGCFLWTFEDPDRAARVHGGEIMVAPAPGPSPRKVPGGLVHHWVGAVFLPDVTMEQVLHVTRDYDRYKDYYQPAVVESKTVARGGAADQFTMQIMNKAFLLKTALDADYQATYVHLDEHRVYSISRTMRVQEMEDYGQPGEHKLPEGEGHGYVWKLFSIARFEQRDSGVYVELEALALSRGIPAAARIFVDPIVHRVSRNSLLISLRQTQEALREETASTARRTTFPAGAERVQNLLVK
jgi:hypothetical protein